MSILRARKTGPELHIYIYIYIHKYFLCWGEQVWQGTLPTTCAALLAESRGVYYLLRAIMFLWVPLHLMLLFHYHVTCARLQSLDIHPDQRTAIERDGYKDKYRMRVRDNPGVAGKKCLISRAFTQASRWTAT